MNAAPPTRARGARPLPRPWPWLVRIFTRYSRYYLRKNFHAVRLSRQGRPPDPGDGPLIVVLNHPSWWDPLTALILKDFFPPDYRHFAPIAAAALKKYRFFERLGFFGVEQNSLRGAADFLEVSKALLARPRTALWVAAQGRFTDMRERPIRLRPGVAHLARRLEGGVVVPLALEYPFWNERFPEALARFGLPIPIGKGRYLSIKEWVSRIGAGLEATQDALAVEAAARDPKAFESCVGGKAGVGGIYDIWRRWRAWLRGERFQAGHGDEPSTLRGAS